MPAGLDVRGWPAHWNGVVAPQSQTWDKCSQLHHFWERAWILWGDTEAVDVHVVTVLSSGPGLVTAGGMASEGGREVHLGQ